MPCKPLFPSILIQAAQSSSTDAVAALREIEVPAPVSATQAAQSTDAPSTEQWVHLVPQGTTMGRDGRGPYTLDVAAVTAAFAQHRADLPVDYEHQMLTATQKSGPVPAAGWITDVQARDNGLWGKVQWTAQAAQLLKERAYRYVSAVFDHLPDGRVVRLKGAGLVHTPNLPLQAAASQQHDLTTTAAQGARMKFDELLERLRYLFNLPTMTDASGVVAELEKVKNKLQSAEATVAAQSQQITTLTTAAQSSAATPDPKQWIPLAQYQMVCAQLTTAQQSQAQSAVDEAVTAAMSEGKVAPALRQWATDYARQDLAGFKAFVASSPVVVAAQAQTIPAATGGVTTAAQALSQEDKLVANLLGVPLDAMAAQKAKS